MRPAPTALITMPATLNATPPKACCGIASSMSHLVKSGGRRPRIDPARMHASTSASLRQYGMKKAPIRRHSALRLILGLSGLNMFDHIKWVGGPPNISAYDTRDNLVF